MSTFDRTFVGVAGALLLSGLVVRTVAQSSRVVASSETQTSSAATLTLQTNPLAAVAGKAANAPSSTASATHPPAKTATAVKPTSGTAAPADTTASKAPGSPSSTPPANGATAKTTVADTPAGTTSPDAIKATDTNAATNSQPAPKPLVQRDGDIIIRASGGIYDQGQDVARVTKDVRVTQEGEDFLLLCQLLTYDRGLNRAIATDDIHISGRDTTMTGDRLDGDFNRKMVVLTGNVVVDSRGKGDGLKSDGAPVSRSKPSHMTCDRIEYNYDTRDAVITGHIHLTQEGSSGTCDKILFDEQNNIVTLLGHSHFVNAQGQAFDGPVIKIWLDSGVARAERLTITVAQTPVPGATKGPVESVPQLPQEWKRDFDQEPLPGRMPTATGSPAPPAKAAAPTAPAPSAPATPDTPAADTNG